MARSKSSNRWLAEHARDQYVKRAQQEGFRSRAAYKLLEIDQKDHLIKPGMIIVDLGAAPGGWSQMAVKQLKNNGKIWALDILGMEPIPGVEFLKGDFTEDQVFQQFLAKLQNQKIDLVLSDMAPNLSGIAVTDQARSVHLAELALEFAQKCLKPGGNLLVKVFQGAGFNIYQQKLQRSFEKVMVRKPKSSRDRSAEVYLLAKAYIPSGTVPDRLGQRPGIGTKIEAKCSKK